MGVPRKPAKPKRAATKKAVKAKPLAALKPKAKAKPKPKAKPTGKHAGGRPPTYRPAFIDIAKGLASVMSATDYEVAQVLGVDERTINRWKLKFPDFNEALKLGKASANDRVEKALYHRAVGYTHQEEEIFCSFGKVTRVKTVKHYPPDTKAALSWLENRKRSEWMRNPPPANDDDKSTAPVIVTVEVKDARRG